MDHTPKQNKLSCGSWPYCFGSSPRGMWKVRIQALARLRRKRLGDHHASLSKGSQGHQACSSNPLVNTTIVHSLSSVLSTDAIEICSCLCEVSEPTIGRLRKVVAVLSMQLFKATSPFHSHQSDGADTYIAVYASACMTRCVDTHCTPFSPAGQHSSRNIQTFVT